MLLSGTLVRGNSQAEGAVYDDWVSNDEDDDLEEEIDPICPNIKVSKEEKRRLRKP